MAHLNLSLLRPAAEIHQNIPLSQSRNLEFMSQHTMRKFKGALPLESLCWVAINTMETKKVVLWSLSEMQNGFLKYYLMVSWKSSLYKRNVIKRCRLRLLLTLELNRAACNYIKAYWVSFAGSLCLVWFQYGFIQSVCSKSFCASQWCKCTVRCSEEHVTLKGI